MISVRLLKFSLNNHLVGERENNSNRFHSFLVDRKLIFFSMFFSLEAKGEGKEHEKKIISAFLSQGCFIIFTFSSINCNN